MFKITIDLKTRLINDYGEYKKKLDRGMKSKRDILLAKAFIANNFSLRAVEDCNFRRWIRSIDEHYIFPNRNDLSQEVFAKLSCDIKEKYVSSSICNNVRDSLFAMI